MESKCMYDEQKKPKVAVLMSAYNGEKYISEQINSILQQTYQNLVLYIRDDGSSDNTVSILEEYERQKKIVLIQGENLGFINSFFDVMKKCETADYYAWCDQDDIWIPDKIERAVEKLEENKRLHMRKGEPHAPVLYFSDYDYYDEQMNFQKHGLDHQRGPSWPIH